jgi:hypothetical protein
MNFKKSRIRSETSTLFSNNVTGPNGNDDPHDGAELGVRLVGKRDSEQVGQAPL